MQLTAPVRIVNQLGVNNDEAWGFSAAQANGGGNQAAYLTAQDTTCKAGIGDQFYVPYVDCRYDAGGNFRLAHYCLKTVPTVSARRYAYFFFSDVGDGTGANAAAPRNVAPNFDRCTVVRVDLHQSRLRMMQGGGNGDPFIMNTEFPVAERLVKTSARPDTYVPFTRNDYLGIAEGMPTGVLANGGLALTHVLLQIETNQFAIAREQDQCGLGPYIRLETGLVFRSKKRVSQPMCAPILNPDVRLGCLPPLNFGTRHLPPEMRDFQLILSDIDFSFLPTPTVGDWEIGPLKTFEFSGGNQLATSQDSLLYLPQFQLHQQNVQTTTFDFTTYTSNGLPSYFAFFCRHDRNEQGYNYNVAQPMIETLNVRCDTTKRTSDVIGDDLGKHHLYHLTMRNVHPFSHYNSSAYNKRQVVLLSAEDIGLMALKNSDYQKLKRLRFQFTGTLSTAGRLHVLLIYNNRGLEIFGADLKVVRL